MFRGWSMLLIPKGLREPKMAFFIFGQPAMNAIIYGFFETFLGCRYGWKLSNEALHVAFGFIVNELEGF
jgi:hypothetical protein